VGFSNERRKTIYRNGNDRVDTMLKDKVLEQALQKVQILKMLIGRCTENKYNKNKKIKKNKKTEPPTVLILHNKFIILI
jgi:hypothetical protein